MCLRPCPLRQRTRRQWRRAMLDCESVNLYSVMLTVIVDAGPVTVVDVVVVVVPVVVVVAVVVVGLTPTASFPFIPAAACPVTVQT